MSWVGGLLWWAIERAMRAPDFRMCEWPEATHVGLTEVDK